MQRRIRQIFTSLREHGRVTYAKIATVGGFCDTDLIMIKATSPDDLPLPDRYVHELLKVFSISPSSSGAFSFSFNRRFGKTRCWRVALKCLLLLHRLLRSVPESSPFRSDLLWARSNALISLYPCRFRDSSSSASEDYTMFIRSYARLLDEALDCFAFDTMTACNVEEEPKSFPDKMKEVSRLLEVLPQLQSLIDRVMECRPTGSAAKSFIVRSTMKHIIRDSFFCYTTFRKEIVMVLENLFQMPYRSCVSAFGIYKKAAVQANQLCEFYDWCKANGLCGSYEYPFIDQIPDLQIRALETFLNGMWQLTDQSSSSMTSPLSLEESTSISTEDDSDKQVARTGIVARTQWEKFEEDAWPKKFEEDEEEPLIQPEVDENVSWEALLESSISLSHENVFYPNGCGYGHGYESGYGSKEEGSEKETDGWKLQIYKPYNPFYQPHSIPNCNELFASNPQYPWGP